MLESDKPVFVVSDLHMGDGGSRDEFRPNAPLFQTVLGDTGYFRVPLKEDSLDYVFTRIKLPAWRLTPLIVIASAAKQSRR